MNIRSAAEWICIALCALLASILNIKILWTECKKRQLEDTKFTTKWLQLFSLLTIIFGTLFTMIRFLGYLPIFCLINGALLYSSIVSQIVFMGFYQLSRIYYCFSQSQVYSKKGYPNCLFIIMFIIGVLVAVNVWFYAWIWMGPNSKCGINNKYQYFFEPIITMKSDSYESITSIWQSVSLSVYLIWDIITLLLYVMKVYSFRKYKPQNIKVYNRIMSILANILILTLCYQFSICLATAIGIFRNLSADNDTLIVLRTVYHMFLISSSTITNYSMFLMQRHNANEYEAFLKILWKLRIHYICCCCRSIIDDVLVMDKMEENTINSIRINSPEYEYDTRTISVKQNHKEPTQISFETITVTHIFEAAGFDNYNVQL